MHSDDLEGLRIKLDLERKKQEQLLHRKAGLQELLSSRKVMPRSSRSPCRHEESVNPEEVRRLSALRDNLNREIEWATKTLRSLSTLGMPSWDATSYQLNSPPRAASVERSTSTAMHETEENRRQLAAALHSQQPSHGGTATSSRVSLEPHRTEVDEICMGLPSEEDARWMECKAAIDHLRLQVKILAQELIDLQVKERDVEEEEEASCKGHERQMVLLRREKADLETQRRLTREMLEGAMELVAARQVRSKESLTS